MLSTYLRVAFLQEEICRNRGKCRTSVYESRGQEFESLRARHQIKYLAPISFRGFKFRKHIGSSAHKTKKCIYARRNAPLQLLVKALAGARTEERSISGRRRR